MELLTDAKLPIETNPTEKVLFSNLFWMCVGQTSYIFIRKNFDLHSSVLIHF